MPLKKPPLALIMEDDLNPEYDEKARISDCQNDPTVWENIQPYQAEFDLFTKPYIGLISPNVKLDEINQKFVTVPIINDFGIRDCLRYPKEKCVYFKPAYCEDMYSIPPKKNETRSLEDSFVGVLNHRFNDTRRRNNRFARKKSVTQTVRKNELPSSKYRSELILGVPTMNKKVVYVPLEPSKKPNKSINALIRDMNNMGLSTNTTRRSRSRSRLRNSTSSSRLRSRTRVSSSI